MAMHRAQSLSRRRLLAGAGVAIASFGLPTRGQAQIASDGFRLLRAQPVGAGHETPSARSALRYDGTLPGPMLRVRRGVGTASGCPTPWTACRT